MRTRWTLALALTLASSWPGAALATTSGDEPLQVLGYAPGDDKLYLLRVPDDGSEALPELSYVVLDGPRAGVVVPVRSWYRPIEAAIDGDDYDAAVAEFERKLDRLRRRLRPARTIAPVCTATTTVRSAVHVTDPWSPEWDTEYELGVSVAAPGGRASAVRKTVTAYAPDVEVVAEVRVPGKPVAVVLVRYFSTPEEHGYDSDIAFGIPLSPALVAAGEAGAVVPYFPYGEPDPDEE